ncbi:SDR family oxidoreductase [Tautonia sociabilis]|uniref:NAD-dependent epimerase/dehydratase family protein n=1 Tax=Tautonia sociabilis TaxID=2080755 RepID=A0A432MDT3_9BACT|nr:SDR family oxidoreductase [Tautonia sociabilis]RUL83101.1 NAD-dependent epimerase/dehydratase family protein [Tautonia sociabilis]
MSDRPLFITGATGALGRRLVRELVETTDRSLILLVRGRGGVSAADRVGKLLGPVVAGQIGSRVELLDGDVTRPGFGLSDADRALLRRRAVEFFHVAALTELNGGRQESEQINVGGTTEALRLAWDLLQEGSLERLFYFSTAYVAGSLRRYDAVEDALNPDPGHANNYEATKYEAERRVRGAMVEGLPVTIFRPSIVVGDSVSGEVTEFNVVYPFFKLYAHGIINLLPARPEDTFNVVPIDFVTAAVRAIAARPDSVGKTYHLVTDRPPTIGTLLTVKEVEFPRMAPITLVDPEEFERVDHDPLVAKIRHFIEPYLGYLRCKLTFDTANTRAALEGSGIPLPETDYRFLTRILQYAVDKNYLLA